VGDEKEEELPNPKEKRKWVKEEKAEAEKSVTSSASLQAGGKAGKLNTVVRQKAMRALIQLRRREKGAKRSLQKLSCATSGFLASQPPPGRCSAGSRQRPHTGKEREKTVSTREKRRVHGRAIVVFAFSLGGSGTEKSWPIGQGPRTLRRKGTCKNSLRSEHQKTSTRLRRRLSNLSQPLHKKPSSPPNLKLNHGESAVRRNDWTYTNPGITTAKESETAFAVSRC